MRGDTNRPQSSGAIYTAAQGKVQIVDVWTREPLFLELALSLSLSHAHAQPF